jgi:hypothetical protein
MDKLKPNQEGTMTTGPRTRRSIYEDIITEATGITGRDVGHVESIMREDIFHSTLDWQSREMLARAAREAAKMLREFRADPQMAQYFPA